LNHFNLAFRQAVPNLVAVMRTIATLTKEKGAEFAFYHQSDVADIG